jgi:hypothetical protein
MPEGALDHVAALIGSLVERWDILVGWIRLDGRATAPRYRGLAKLITISGGIGQRRGGLRQLLDKVRHRENIVCLSSGKVEGNQAARSVGDGMDLGRPPTAAASDRLLLAPRFPPAAWRCLGGRAVDALRSG